MVVVVVVVVYHITVHLKIMVIRGNCHAANCDFSCYKSEFATFSKSTTL